MGKVFAIAGNTYREARRNRVLAIFLFFALALMIVSGVAAELAIGEKDKIMRDLGLAGINLFGLLVALFVGIGVVHNDIERRTIYTIISKPINRAHFIAGKYLGLLLTLYIATLLMTVFFFGVLHFSRYAQSDAIHEWLRARNWHNNTTSWQMLQYYGQHLFAAFADALLSFWAPFVDPASYPDYTAWLRDALAPLGLSPDLAQVAASTKNLLPAIGLTCMELAIVTAFAVLFSVVSTPFLAFFFTAVMVVIGRLNQDIMSFADHLTRKTEYADLAFGSKISYWFAHAASLASPNLNVFNQRYSVIYKGILPDASYLAGAAVYGACYSLVIVCLAIFIFNRRAFK